MNSINTALAVKQDLNQISKTNKSVIIIIIIYIRNITYAGMHAVRL